MYIYFKLITHRHETLSIQAKNSAWHYEFADL